MNTQTMFPDWFNPEFPDLDYGEPVDNVKPAVPGENEASDGAWSTTAVHGSDSEYPPSRPRILTLIDNAPLPKRLPEPERKHSWASMSESDNDFNPPKGPKALQSFPINRSTHLQRPRVRATRVPSPSYVPHWSSKKGINRMRDVLPLVKSTRSRAMLLQQHMQEIFNARFLPAERIPEVLQRFEDLVHSSDRTENLMRELIMDNDKYKCHVCPRSGTVVRPRPDAFRGYPDYWRPHMDHKKSRSPDKRTMAQAPAPNNQLANMRSPQLQLTLPIRTRPAPQTRRAESIPPAIDWQMDGAYDFDGFSDATVVEEDADMSDSESAENGRESSPPLPYTTAECPDLIEIDVEGHNGIADGTEHSEDEDDDGEMEFDDEEDDSIVEPEPAEPEISDEEKRQYMQDVANLQRDQIWGDGWTENWDRSDDDEDYAWFSENYVPDEKTTGKKCNVLLHPVPNYRQFTNILQNVRVGKIVGAQCLRVPAKVILPFMAIRFETEEAAQKCVVLIEELDLVMKGTNSRLEAILLERFSLPLSPEVVEAMENGATRVLEIHHALDILIKCEPKLEGMARFFLRTKINRADLANRAMHGLLKDLKCSDEDEYRLVECARLTKKGSLVIRFCSVYAAMKVKELMKKTIQYSLARITFARDPCDDSKVEESEDEKEPSDEDMEVSESESESSDEETAAHADYSLADNEDDEENSGTESFHSTKTHHGETLDEKCIIPIEDEDKTDSIFLADDESHDVEEAFTKAGVDEIEAEIDQERETPKESTSLFGLAKDAIFRGWMS